MTDSVLLVGFSDQGNLGIGYLAAALQRRGRQVHIVDVRDDRDHILGVAQRVEPVLVGFSLIFQYYLPQFAALASWLRARGLRAHFTIGGHYASLCHADVLEAIPALDSVVRFEGEETLVELVDALVQQDDWQEVHGLAYRRDGDVKTTAPAR